MALYIGSDYNRVAKGPGDGSGFDSAETYRSEFRRDYGRLIHCAAFRRLVGKTQLFPGIESDFFRNRLTHSLEVAQIAKSIAIKLNAEQEFFSTENHGPINTDLVEVAGLAHDLGHPPFGHNGELALDECMLHAGGFEGNAQTLRLLSRIEKKKTTDPAGVGVLSDGQDCRFGLDLCMRTLASILKYDTKIPVDRATQNGKVVKGYFESESGLVAKIKQSVCPTRSPTEKFKTVECMIMDLADDIAYSTYDLEDAFKAGFLTPFEMLTDEARLRSVIDDVNRGRAEKVTDADVRGVLLNVFDKVFEDNAFPDDGNVAANYQVFLEALERRYVASCKIARNGYARTDLTSLVVGDHISNVKFYPNEDCPALSRVELDSDTELTVAVFKSLAYNALIMSPRLRVAEIRGHEVVREIFNKLSEPEGFRLMPEDFQMWHQRLTSREDRMRVICDFIAGMTDRYAVEFYARLTSEYPQSIFKPI